jgi:hypothetical protein
VLPDEVCQAITGIIMDVTKPWAKQRRAEDRSVSVEARRMDRLAAGDKPMTIKDAVYNVMTEAYMTVSDNDTLPANARQIMYAARPKILELAKIGTLNDTYFTQTLLVDYINENPHECKDWNVVWSDRGHFAEPHTGKIVGLGTLAVRSYLDEYAAPEFAEAGFAEATITTHGPDGRYSAMLYIEKEGFDPLIEQAQIAERHDLAMMSCKGMSVTAARELVDRTCAIYGITLLIMHDFDVSGFSIAKTLPSSNRRYKLETEGEFKVIDIGLRLADVEQIGLASEPVDLGKNKGNRRQNLIDNGATEAEIAFLLDTDNPEAGDRTGKRVELAPVHRPDRAQACRARDRESHPRRGSHQRGVSPLCAQRQNQTSGGRCDLSHGRRRRRRAGRSGRQSPRVPRGSPRSVLGFRCADPCGRRRLVRLPAGF